MGLICYAAIDDKYRFWYLGIHAAITHLWEWLWKLLVAENGRALRKVLVKN